MAVIRAFGKVTPMITSRQIRAGRALLNWTQQQVADAAIVSLNAVRRLEKEEGDPRVSTVLSVEQALRKAGIEFLADDGVRLAPSSKKTK